MAEGRPGERIDYPDIAMVLVVTQAGWALSIDVYTVLGRRAEDGAPWLPYRDHDLASGEERPWTADPADALRLCRIEALVGGCLRIRWNPDQPRSVGTLTTCSGTTIDGIRALCHRVRGLAQARGFGAYGDAEEPADAPG